MHVCSMHACSQFYVYKCVTYNAVQMGSVSKTFLQINWQHDLVFNRQLNNCYMASFLKAFITAGEQFRQPYNFYSHSKIFSAETLSAASTLEITVIETTKRTCIF